VDLPFGRQFLADIRDRTETAMPQAHAFLAAELALRAELQATNITSLVPSGNQPSAVSTQQAR
jgi:hypothetical protein